MFDPFLAPPVRAPSVLALAWAGAAAILLAGCAQNPRSASRSSEFFPASKYGPASPRVVTEGDSVPRGGGRRLVGRPYTVAGKRYVPSEVRPGFTVTGTASWYGAAFHGRRTANGEVYDMRALSAAHPTMPLPSYARVTNTRNGHSIIVRVNDRGPFHAGRVLDVSQKVAEKLDFRRSGTGSVKVDYIGPAGLAGSDDVRLMASLRTDGRPATLDGPSSAPTTMIAQAAPQAAPAQAASLQTSSAGVSEIPRQLEPSRPAFTRSPQEPQQIADAGAGRLINVSAPAFAPLPPPRPLDLLTIPGADTPIAAPRSRGLRPSFFAAPSPVASTLLRRKPFEGVDLVGLQPLR